MIKSSGKKINLQLSLGAKFVVLAHLCYATERYLAYIFFQVAVHVSVGLHLLEL